MANVFWSVLAHWVAVALLGSVGAQYSSDQCNWRGSGLSHESHRQDVEQVYLRCSQGSLEWLYPTGALIVNLRPNTEPPPGAGASPGPQACIKARADSRGAQVYVQRAGELRLLLGEGRQGLGRVQCFGLAEGALFVEAVGQRDISRRMLAFQYELVTSHALGAPIYPYLSTGTAVSQPCTDKHVLMAVCTSDYVGRGSIHAVDRSSSPDHVILSVTLTQLFRQRGGVFVRGGARGRVWSGHLNTPLQCRLGEGQEKEEELLLTGVVHFGEAWLGCAPRYSHFLKLYRAAQEAGTNPCHMDTD